MLRLHFQSNPFSSSESSTDSNWLLYPQVHGGLLCQFCLKLFKKVSEIEAHLKSTHDVSKLYFHSPRTFLNYAGTKYSLVCSMCSEVVAGKV